MTKKMYYKTNKNIWSNFNALMAIKRTENEIKKGNFGMPINEYINTMGVKYFK